MAAEAAVNARIEAESAVFNARLEAESAAFNARMEALARRHEALTMSLELMSHESETARKQRDKDSQNIRALARIADMQGRRLSKLEEKL